MQVIAMRRWARNALPLFLFLTLTQACRDIGTTPSDDWTARTSVGMKVRSQLVAFDQSRRFELGGVAEPGSVTRMPNLTMPAHSSAFVEPGANIVVRHFRKSGRLHSIGAVFDGDGRPPKLVYAFEDGRIRAVVSSKYTRVAGRWQRTHSRITYFDSTGTPRLQASSQPFTEANSSQQPAFWAGSAPRDLLELARHALVPRELHAETGGCLGEWLVYLAASGALALASSTVSGAVAACLGGGPLAPTACATVEAAAVAWAGALAAWNAALDKLAVCESKNSWVPTGGGSRESSSGDSGEGDRNGESTAVVDFINTAIRTGNYYCTDSGDYCVFYAI
jgi:hypothetical protein